MDNQTIQNVNPLMQRLQMPGETFTLPSGGIFYDDEIISTDSENAEIHVHPMTAIDEITIKTPDLLFSGKAIHQVFKRCLPQIRDVDKMLAKDVDFLLVCLRKVSYGNELPVEFQHDCENAKTHQYTIDVNSFISNAKRIDPTTLTQNFHVTMPNGQELTLRPVSFKSYVNIMQSGATRKEDSIDPEKLKVMMIDSLADIIKDVDGITDRNMIREWLEGIPPSFYKLLNNKVEDTLDWGPNFNYDTICKDCEQKIVVTAPLNPLSFFT